MIKGNKGEWSEIYVLLKLLGDGKIYAADENINKMSELCFPIIKIIRYEKDNEFYEYRISNNKATMVLNGKDLGEYDSAIFSHNALTLLTAMMSTTETTFSVEDVELFIKSIGCNVLKVPVINAKGIKLGKTDITMQLHDPLTGHRPISGFSIKSRIGNSSTLLNASGATNFIYKISGLNESEISEINDINTRSKVRDRLAMMKAKGAKIEFAHLNNSTFSANLELVDIKFEEVLARALLYFYGGECVTVTDAVKKLNEENPLSVKNSAYYNKCLKKFLVNIALGMQPATPWDGTDEAEGGCIWVKKDGEVLIYYIWNHNKLEEHLLKNTKFETPSTRRHGFASLYTQNNEIFMKLNLQIRFIN